ncbi:MAG: hypothetical protein KDN22_31205 [Verrucomicrobiae bacterium]|nr:hypothetical protein [Verrucomicrobiae bacterium]
MCRSADRRKEEAAMLEQKRARLQAKLEAIYASLRKRPAKIEAAERRVGRWRGRYPLLAIQRFIGERGLNLCAIVRNDGVIGLMYQRITAHRERYESTHRIEHSRKLAP